MNRFKEMWSIISTLNNKNTDTQIQFHKATVVPILIYGSEIWTVKTNRKQKLKLQKGTF
jgi:hypothetical protein